ncbi:MAG TPA: DUF4124 domain-containing protein [Steroidobacteraceae bacterium]
MNKQSVLFPWILASLSIGGIAVSASTSPTLSPPPAAASAPPAQAPESAPVPSQQAAPKQSGEIWQCVTNGVRTFSNNPCGEKSSLVKVRPINTMAPPPVIRYTRANGPDSGYAQRYADQDGYKDEDNSDQGFDDNSDSGVQGFAYVPLIRADHSHRPKHFRGSRSEQHKLAAQPNSSAPAAQRAKPAPRRN